MRPQLKQFLVCKDVRQDPATHQIHIDGVFDTLRPVGSPHALDSLCVFFVCADADERAVFRFLVADADGNIVFGSNEHGVDFLDRFQRTPVSIRVNGGTFPGPGVYFVELYCDGLFVDDAVLTLAAR